MQVRTGPGAGVIDGRTTLSESSGKPDRYRTGRFLRCPGRDAATFTLRGFPTGLTGRTLREAVSREPGRSSRRVIIRRISHRELNLKRSRISMRPIPLAL